MAQLNNNPEYNYFFNPPTSTGTNDSERDMISRMKAENLKIFKRVGHRSIYTRLLELNCFNGLAATPLQSVKVANFEEAVKILSFKNAGA